MKQKYGQTGVPRPDLRSPAHLELPAEQNWSALDAPADAPWSFTILFVGVDNAKEPDLKLKLEFEKIEQAYKESDISKHTNCRVTIKWLVFSRWEDVME